MWEATLAGDVEKKALSEDFFKNKTECPNQKRITIASVLPTAKYNMFQYNPIAHIHQAFQQHVHYLAYGLN